MSTVKPAKPYNGTPHLAAIRAALKALGQPTRTQDAWYGATGWMIRKKTGPIGGHYGTAALLSFNPGRDGEVIADRAAIVTEGLRAAGWIVEPSGFSDSSLIVWGAGAVEAVAAEAERRRREKEEREVRMAEAHRESEELSALLGTFGIQRHAAMCHGGVNLTLAQVRHIIAVARDHENLSQ